MIFFEKNPILRNPFFEVICNRANLKKEMKNPFEFAKKLLRYSREELSGQEGDEVENVLKENEELEVLAQGLKDRERISEELKTLGIFDVEKALQRVNRKRGNGRRLFIPWVAAASVVFVAGMMALFLLNRTPRNVMEGISVAIVEPGKAQVTLEMASGARFVLDTLTSTIRNDKANVAFENSEGMLRVEEQTDTLKDNITEEGNNKIIVPYGGTYSLALADGTKVYLNSGTELEFPSRFSKEKRQVVLKGEAYFEVVRNEHQPFVVQVGEMAVKVLGTSFNVKSYVDEPGVYTTLVEGSVAIVRKGQPEQKIVPGEQAYYNKGVGTLSVTPVNVAEFIAWKDGFFFFKDLPLEEILRIVSRWYDLEVFYVNQGARSVVYSGKLPMYSSVEDVLRKFEISGEVRFELKGRTLMVYDK